MDNLQGVRSSRQSILPGTACGDPAATPAHQHTTQQPPHHPTVFAKTLRSLHEAALPLDILQDVRARQPASHATCTTAQPHSRTAFLLPPPSPPPGYSPAVSHSRDGTGDGSNTHDAWTRGYRMGRRELAAPHTDPCHSALPDQPASIPSTLSRDASPPG